MCYHDYIKRFCSSSFKSFSWYFVKWGMMITLETHQFIFYYSIGHCHLIFELPVEHMSHSVDRDATSHSLYYIWLRSTFGLSLMSDKSNFLHIWPAPVSWCCQMDIYQQYDEQYCHLISIFSDCAHIHTYISLHGCSQ
jgi:hypothetical protein